MHRIDTTVPAEKWRYACPDPERHHNWRVADGVFECRACQEIYQHLIDTKTGERIQRNEIEFVGPEADHQGQFGRPTVND